MLFLHSLFLLALSHIFSPGGVFAAPAVQYNCPNSSVTFEFEEPEDIRCVCTATSTALAFLKSIGLETTDLITIRLVEQIASNRDHLLLGAYNPVSDEVTLLTYPKAVERLGGNAPMPGVEMSEELWCSYAAHELAHVISCRYLSSKVEARTTGEYIAAVTQLTVLPEEIREKILRQYKGVTAYQSRAEMSELYFLLDPHKFAVKCYLHFISLENPKRFIELFVKEGNGF